MADGLYDIDALAWAEQQADLLRRLSQGERVNDAVDWSHVIEEVADVGLSQLNACRNLLRQAMIHLLKLHAWPDSLSAGHWRDEAGVFLDDAADAFAPSMRQRIDLATVYEKALRRVDQAVDESGPSRRLPTVCPFTLDLLLDGELLPLLTRIEDTE